MKFKKILFIIIFLTLLQVGRIVFKNLVFVFNLFDMPNAV